MESHWFPTPNVDEGIYLGRTTNFLDCLDPRDQSIGYDHPYFGQVLLACLLYITGYQNFFDSPEDLNYEMIFLIPRIFMGILALVDTLLIFKIAELRYNRNVGFIASVLFAVMPITWLTRWILLDSIQLPLFLLSILFALLCFRQARENTNIYSKNIFLVLLSGIFLGLSIFTKIPAFTMIPLIGYLIFRGSKMNFKILALWFVPVLLIPLIWPLRSISVGEFNKWFEGINDQAHRESSPLYFTIREFLIIDPILFICGNKVHKHEVIVLHYQERVSRPAHSAFQSHSSAIGNNSVNRSNMYFDLYPLLRMYFINASSTRAGFLQ